jgi:GTP-binding protein HflX
MRAVVLVPLRPEERRSRPSGNGKRPTAGAALRSPEDRLEEAVGLAKAIDLDVRSAQIVPLAHPQPSTLIGSGKVAEVAALVAEQEAGLAVVDHPLSAIQQRNLEKAWNCKVLDRTGLILDNFGERALTRQGRLQVELAHLTYQKGPLVRTSTH